MIGIIVMFLFLYVFIKKIVLFIINIIKSVMEIILLYFIMVKMIEFIKINNL